MRSPLVLRWICWAGFRVGSRLARVGSGWVPGLFRASLGVAALWVLGWFSAGLWWASWVSLGWV